MRTWHDPEAGALLRQPGKVRVRGFLRTYCAFWAAVPCAMGLTGSSRHPPAGLVAGIGAAFRAGWQRASAGALNRGSITSLTMG